MGAEEQPRSKKLVKVGEISATPVGAIAPESALSARYELMGRLGLGGMAELYLARAVGIGDFEKVVVLKRILDSRAHDPDFVRMFEDEARVAATLEHPNIVTTHDIGRDGDEVFFTMEYLHGENVKRILAGAKQVGEPVPVELALQIAIGCAAGLHHAHEQRAYSGEPLDIVHRDVSPSNIIVTYQSGVKLIDFGIAKAASAKHITEVGVVKGKASYMSPEQCRGEALDRRSDVFSLGIALYELLTMQRPFNAPEPLAVLAKIVNEEVVRPTELRPGIPIALERVVLRALAKRPDDRYPTAFSLQEDLELVMREHKLHALPGALGRYLEHLFGAKPYPWAQHYRVSPPPLPEWTRPREPDSLVTTPRQRIDEGVTPSHEGSTATEEEGPATEPSRIAARVMLVETPPLLRTEPTPVPVHVLLEAAPPRRRAGLFVLGGAAIVAVVAAALAWPKAEATPSAEPRPDAVVAALAPAKPEPVAPPIDAAPMKVTPTRPPDEPPPAIARAPEEPTPAPEPDAVRPSSPSSATSSRPSKRESDAQRKKDAAKLVEEGRAFVFSAPEKAQERARRAIAMSPSQEAWSLLGVASCRAGDSKSAQQARAKLSESRREQLDRTCEARGIVLTSKE
ncbi:MAG TPA: serine/threonine-protein kinase [Nannocystaceae bacterium]|nr:serine/threonine-protein kinase [Nannocystaceae bacterium]